MSVIITEKIPENCKKCPLSYRDNYFSQNPPLQCNFVYAPLGLAEDERHNDCPLKSVDGLIEKIESINSTDYGSVSSYEAHNAVRDVKRDIIEIIKEYCGMEAKED